MFANCQVSPHNTTHDPTQDTTQHNTRRVCQRLSGLELYRTDPNGGAERRDGCRQREAGTMTASMGRISVGRSKYRATEQTAAAANRYSHITCGRAATPSAVSMNGAAQRFSTKCVVPAHCSARVV